MIKSRRYYCQISVSTSINAGNFPKQNIAILDEKIEQAVSEWAEEMGDKGITVGINWIGHNIVICNDLNGRI